MRITFHEGTNSWRVNGYILISNDKIIEPSPFIQSEGYLVQSYVFVMI